MKLVRKMTAMMLGVSMLTVAATGCSNPSEPTSSTQTDGAEKEKPEADEEAPKEDATQDPGAQEQSEEDWTARYADLILEETDETVTFIDGMDNEKTITKQPEKTVVLLNSILDLWYLAGGEAVARVKGTTNVPEAAMDIVDLGTHTEVSLEALLELEPDLVLMHTTATQTQFADILDQNGIEWAVVDTSSDAFASFQNNAYIFSEILDTPEAFEENVFRVIEEVENITEQTKATEESPLTAVLYTSGRSIKMDTEKATVGQMLDMLGAQNIVESHEVVIEDSTRVDFSFEKLIEKDPEHIFFVIMGNEESAREKVRIDLESNEAWNNLSAVKNGNVHYLPKDLFTYKANARYGEALTYLAEIIFEEVDLTP